MCGGYLRSMQTIKPGAKTQKKLHMPYPETVQMFTVMVDAI